MIFALVAKKALSMGLKHRAESHHDGEKPAGGSKVALILRAAIRFLQFVLALTAAGIYGHCIVVLNQNKDSWTTNCTYAVIVGGLSCATCILYMMPFIKSHAFFIWDAVLFILWVGVFGAFGKIYINQDFREKVKVPAPHKPSGKKGQKAHKPPPQHTKMVEKKFHHLNNQMMKNTVWLDAICMCLWFATATYGLIVFLKSRRGNKKVTQMSQV
ncbi:MAG: hypothetical protein M1831_000197 [Alyxoria varia]|nr:MAG: hypothetical protein M1831_000197 [Alyxoria varia]